MRLKFWGVRGSLPTPITPKILRSKVAGIIQRIRSKDLESPESRDAFLADLPDYLFGTVGGNTTCIELRLSDNTLIIFDAGTGIRELGVHLSKYEKTIREIHLFFTHFHWDHIQGFPFFAPAFNPNVKLNIYSPDPHLEAYLKYQMKPPFFPVTMDVFQSKINFVHLEKQPLKLGKGQIQWISGNHPGDSYGFKVSEKGKSMIFYTDTELREEDFTKNQDNIDFFKNSDVIILDSQYTLTEAIEKYNWGHTSYSLAVDFAAAFRIKKLFLFHHEPMYDDKNLAAILRSANWYCNHNEVYNNEVYLAEEGMEIEI